MKPEEAVLDMSHLDSKNTFFLAHHNLCPLNFKRAVMRDDGGGSMDG